MARASQALSQSSRLRAAASQTIGLNQCSTSAAQRRLTQAMPAAVPTAPVAHRHVANMPTSGPASRGGAAGTSCAAASSAGAAVACGCAASQPARTSGRDAICATARSTRCTGAALLMLTALGRRRGTSRQSNTGSHSA